MRAPRVRPTVSCGLRELMARATPPQRPSGGHVSSPHEVLCCTATKIAPGHRGGSLRRLAERRRAPVRCFDHPLSHRHPSEARSRDRLSRLQTPASTSPLTDGCGRQPRFMRPESIEDPGDEIRWLSPGATARPRRRSRASVRRAPRSPRDAPPRGDYHQRPSPSRLMTHSWSPLSAISARNLPIAWCSGS